MKNVKQRRMMLALPLLIIPFLTMGFWALGGGSGMKSPGNAVAGLNLELPDPKQSNDNLTDKLSFYDAAEKDSLKRAEYTRSDPYYQERDTSPAYTNELEQLTIASAGKYNQHLNVSPFDKKTEAPEDEIIAKLKMLQQSLASPEPAISNVDTERPRTNYSPDVDRLSSMMSSMNIGDSEDPDMKQLNVTLEKILDVQHPERVKEQKKRSLTNIQRVETNKDSVVIGFYGLENDPPEEKANAIQAVVHENKVLVNGAVIKIRLTSDIFIGAVKIPAGNLIYGVAGLDGERLTIEINSIQYQHSLYDVKLAVYDMDGLPGIYIPGAISREVSKQGADNMLSLMDMSSMDPSLKAQATAAGIGTLKNLLSKKVKLVRVMVKAGYKVLLKNKN
jgi:hypothetical protein